MFFSRSRSGLAEVLRRKQAAGEPPQRRGIMRPVSLSLAYSLLFSTIVASIVCAEDAKPTFRFRSERKAGQTDQVSVVLEFGGNFLEGSDGKRASTAISGTDRLAYYERTVETGAGRATAVRYYEKAESGITIKDHSRQQSLAGARRFVGVSVDLPTVTLFSLKQPLTRDELEVIDILGNTLLLDRLLPEGAVAVGERWKPADDVMAALLGLDGATHCDVQCMLKEVTSQVARFELAGTVEGPVCDTSARIELRGRYRLDRRTGRIDWFALVTNEHRAVSDVAEGFDIATRLQTVITPLRPSSELTDENLKGLNLEPTPELCKLIYQSPQGHWQIDYDRRWYPTGETTKSATLKLIDRQSLGAQCNIFSLPRREPDKRLSLKEFQTDVKKVLAEDFSEFVDANESADKIGRRVLRVAVRGVVHGKPTPPPKAESETAKATDGTPDGKPAETAEDSHLPTGKSPTPAGKPPADIPIRWIYYHISDVQGRQVAITFTIEQQLVERFADADKAIVEALRFE
jgi:hypothetical protein